MILCQNQKLCDPKDVVGLPNDCIAEIFLFHGTFTRLERVCKLFHEVSLLIFERNCYKKPSIGVDKDFLIRLEKYHCFMQSNKREWEDLCKKLPEIGYKDKDINDFIEKRDRIKKEKIPLRWVFNDSEFNRNVEWFHSHVWRIHDIPNKLLKYFLYYGKGKAWELFICIFKYKKLYYCIQIEVDIGCSSHKLIVNENLRQFVRELEGYFFLS